MIEVADLKAKRQAAGIAGIVLCKKMGMARSRLSDIERGYITPSSDDLAQIDAVLNELIHAKSILQKTAVHIGWPGGDVR